MSKCPGVICPNCKSDRDVELVALAAGIYPADFSCTCGGAHPYGYRFGARSPAAEAAAGAAAAASRSNADAIRDARRNSNK